MEFKTGGVSMHRNRVGGHSHPNVGGLPPIFGYPPQECVVVPLGSPKAGRNPK